MSTEGIDNFFKLADHLVVKTTLFILLLIGAYSVVAAKLGWTGNNQHNPPAVQATPTPTPTPTPNKKRAKPKKRPDVAAQKPAGTCISLADT